MPAIHLPVPVAGPAGPTDSQLENLFNLPASFTDCLPVCPSLRFSGFLLLLLWALEQHNLLVDVVAVVVVVVFAVAAVSIAYALIGAQESGRLQVPVF